MIHAWLLAVGKKSFSWQQSYPSPINVHINGWIFFFAYARNLILFYCAVVPLHSLCLWVIWRVSKFVDQIAVANQLQHHLFTDNLFPASQSAYRPNHSTETALLRVTNDILIKMNNQRVTLLTLLLDLSTAFAIPLIMTLSWIGSGFHLTSTEKTSLGLSHIFRGDLSKCWSMLYSLWRPHLGMWRASAFLSRSSSV